MQPRATIGITICILRQQIGTHIQNRRQSNQYFHSIFPIPQPIRRPSDTLNFSQHRPFHSQTLLLGYMRTHIYCAILASTHLQLSGPQDIYTNTLLTNSSLRNLSYRKTQTSYIKCQNSYVRY